MPRWAREGGRWEGRAAGLEERGGRALAAACGSPGEQTNSEQQGGPPKNGRSRTKRDKDSWGFSGALEERRLSGEGSEGWPALAVAVLKVRYRYRRAAQSISGTGAVTTGHHARGAPASTPAPITGGGSAVA